MKLVSLGRNCEVSFQIQKYLGDEWDASLFSWAYILDDSHLIQAISNPDQLLQGEVYFHYPTDDMFVDEDFQIAFHGRTGKDEMIDGDGQIIDMDKYLSAIGELKMDIQEAEKILAAL